MACCWASAMMLSACCCARSSVSCSSLRMRRGVLELLREDPANLVENLVHVLASTIFFWPPVSGDFASFTSCRARRPGSLFPHPAASGSPFEYGPLLGRSRALPEGHITSMVAEKQRKSLNEPKLTHSAHRGSRSATHVGTRKSTSPPMAAISRTMDEET